MRITAIETIALVDPGKASETVVRVHTDEGISGIGQAESPSLVIDAIIRCDGGLEELLRGEDPLQVERLWQKMYAATGLFGRSGSHDCRDRRGGDCAVGHRGARRWAGRSAN